MAGIEAVEEVASGAGLEAAAVEDSEVRARKKAPLIP